MKQFSKISPLKTIGAYQTDGTIYTKYTNVNISRKGSGCGGLPVMLKFPK